MNFSATTYQNEFLAAGAARVDAIVTVEATGIGSVPETNASAIVIMLDVSGSMSPRTKWNALQHAAAAAISQIRDGVQFAVLAGSDVVEVVYPRAHGLAVATETTRAQAIACVERVRPAGGTAIGRWLLAGRDLLAPCEGSIRQAILVTDGRDEGESRDELYAAVWACQGVFQCDCRGVGTDWGVAELRWIASCLLGSVDIVAEPADMPADFEALMVQAMAKRTADVRLRIWTPRGATVAALKQVLPAIDDLTPRAIGIDERTVEYATGAWGDESRDFYVTIAVPPQHVGAEMLAGRVSLVIDGQTVSQSPVKAIWTDDVVASTRLHPRLAHYTNQVELAGAIADGLAARQRGDVTTATQKFGEAARRAVESGNDETLRLIAGVVDVLDAPTGTVRLRGSVSAVDTMTLDTRSTKTVPVRPDA